LPRWDATAAGTGPRATAASNEHRARFTDVAASAGLRFQYFTGAVAATRGKRMYEFTGGGIAVLDYDGDGWPDLYLTQGCAWPPREGAAEHLDRLYRNRGDGTFEDVTERAGLREARFSQGVTVGDFDNDGHPDLYVANIGANRLFRNHGDGTFEDVTELSGTAGNRWTTSCLLADLNGDTWPDIYAVNYLSGDDLFDRICEAPGGQLEICPPHIFAAAQDQLYINLGDGRFEEQTDSAGIAIPQGKGLGIVAADFEGSGRLSLFIANDAVPNFYFVNQTPQRGGKLAFVEQGLASGLALNASGNPQACMGIAAGDADQDGRLDLFVTNFYQESNTLYLQQAPNLFADATRAAGLEEPSFLMLGFGTQFLDGDLDGRPDLVVANGNVGEDPELRIPYRMRPQYFANLGGEAGARFAELPAAKAGPYFAGEYLGRGLARLDWNRDGREDFAVTHLDAPAALLSNETPRKHHFLALHLRGVASDRDAIGSTVRVTAGARTWVRQLTAGDGYQASNQRMLLFGLGSEAQVQQVEIRWPSGGVQTYADLPVDREWLLIEGRAQARLIPGAP
jgi:hypothetical protein